MKKALRAITQKLSSNKIIAAFLILASITVVGASSSAAVSAHRYAEYFSVEKPTSASVCEGGSWTWESDWSWRGWRWHKQWYRAWSPNWQQLGFESKGHCLRYVSTPKPVSRQDCRQNWWKLGFDSRRDCRRYLKLYPGGGYGGNPQMSDAQQGNRENESEDQED